MFAHLRYRNDRDTFPARIPYCLLSHDEASRMTKPGEGLPQKQPVTPEVPTGVMRSIEQLDALNANRLEPLPPETEPLPEAPPYKKERLFSRKVMIGWAAATLLIWFALSFITPIIAETVKAEIMSRMEPPTTNTAIPVEPVPAIPGEPVTPAEPAPPPEPAKPPAPKK